MKLIGRWKLTSFTASLTLLALAALGLRSSAATPTSAELKLRRQWVAQHFDSKAGPLPFSFTYGERPARELLPTWKVERVSSKPRAGRTQRTLTCVDPGTGLRVRCDLVEYDDFPAVE